MVRTEIEFARTARMFGFVQLSEAASGVEKQLRAGSEFPTLSEPVSKLLTLGRQIG